MNDSPERRSEFESRLRSRMKAITGSIAAPADLGRTVESRARQRAGRTRAMRVASVAIVSVGAVSGVAWARSGSPAKIASAPPETPVETAADGSTSVAPDPTAPDQSAPVTAATFPAADPSAKNFLVVGLDNNDCVDPDSASAGSFGDRTTLGERTDTIMVVRVEPSTGRASILSFPRDLWVAIAGTNTKGRINSASQKNDPTRLIDTIHENFDIGIDHLVQIDFCAFKTIVDAVGGVTVPFEYATRDRNTGLDVRSPGCVAFDGDEALAYVRSRHYEYRDSAGAWHEDPSSDYGRIARQQDFAWRLLSTVINSGAFSPGAALSLIDEVQPYVVVDANMTLDTMLEFAGVMNDLDEDAITNYQVAGTGKVIAGAAVLEPQLDDPNMQAILEIFRGLQQLPGPTTDVTVSPDSAPAATSAAPIETIRGIVPPAGGSC